MNISIDYFNKKNQRDKLIHVFVLSNPLAVFISKMIIERYKIPQKKIILISYRNTNIDLLKGKKIDHKLNFFDKVFRRLFLFSLYGYRLKVKIEKEQNDFIFYCDWDNRDVIELLNSKRCVGQAYLEEGQCAFNNLNEYEFKKSRIFQWSRLRRWKKSVDLRQKYSPDKHYYFNEFFNNSAFCFFSISSDCYPLINKNKKIILDNFGVLLKSYKPKLIGIQSIGLMCSPRRLKNNNWNFAINSLLNILPNKSVIKLHPAFYDDPVLIKKFKKKLDYLRRDKEIEICSSSVIVEAEMLFENKILYGPLTSLEKYADDFGSVFNKIKLY